MKKLVKICSVVVVLFMILNTLAFSVIFIYFIDSPIWRISLIINGLGAVIILTHLITYFDEDKLF